MIRSFDSLQNFAQRTRKEAGQAIMIVALAMIALLAFTGLAIDGGGLIALYRDAVNATDAAVLAASYAICVRDDPTSQFDSVEAAALDAAAKNGFNNDGVTNTVTVVYPALVDGVYNEDYVSIAIDAEKPAYFIQVVRSEPLLVHTESVGYCRQKFNPATVGAIFGISDTCDNSVDISGAGQYIEGSVTSNSDIDFTGGGQPVTIDGDLSAAGTVEINPSKVEVTGTPTSGAPKTDNPLDIINIRDYAPGGAIYEALPDDKVHYINGDYSPAKNSVLEGLYFVEGDVTIRPSDNVSWGNEGATIVSMGVMDLHVDKGVPPVYYTELLSLGYTDLPVIGFIFFTTAGEKGCTGNASNNAISYTGDINTTGVVYGPNGVVDASFPNVTYIGAIIGWRVKLSGSSATIIHDPALLPPLPPKVYVAQ